jgi:hypothetical protein
VVGRLATAAAFFLDTRARPGRLTRLMLSEAVGQLSECRWQPVVPFMVGGEFVVSTS